MACHATWNMTTMRYRMRAVQGCVWGLGAVAWALRAGQRECPCVEGREGGRCMPPHMGAAQLPLAPLFFCT